MAEDLTADQALEKVAPWDVMLKRGLRKRCPRCGSGHLYTSWFRMKDRCPGCGFKFDREPGFFIGAYFINFVIAEGFMFVMLMVYIAALNRDSGTSQVGPIVLGLTFAIVCPLVFYPFARTIWSAIDLAMSPLELDEIIAARDHLSGADTVPTPGRTGTHPEVEPGQDASPGAR